MPMPEKELPSREKKLVLVVSVYAIGNLLWECWGFAFRLRKNPLYGYYPKGEIILTSPGKMRITPFARNGFFLGTAEGYKRRPAGGIFL
jgi:hypothetical protein